MEITETDEMRRSKTRFGIRISQILCLLALTMSIFSGAAFAETTEMTATTSHGNNAAQVQAVDLHRVDIAASEASKICSIDGVEACGHHAEHEHLSSECGATHCLTGTLPSHAHDINASEAQRFVSALISIMPSGAWLNLHRPPNS
jgi:hypothetical protein